MTETTATRPMEPGLIDMTPCDGDVARNDTAHRLLEELHALMDRAIAYADEDGLSRLHQLLVYLSEGADLHTFQVAVPDGLDHNPVFRRRLLAQQLLDLPTQGKC